MAKIFVTGNLTSYHQLFSLLEKLEKRDYGGDITFAIFEKQVLMHAIC